MADPASFLGPHSILGTFYSPDNSLFTHLGIKINMSDLIDDVNIDILRLNLLATRCPFNSVQICNFGLSSLPQDFFFSGISP